MVMCISGNPTVAVRESRYRLKDATVGYWIVTIGPLEIRLAEDKMMRLAAEIRRAGFLRENKNVSSGSAE